ncbi:methionyl-tRNA formyltransferase [Sphingomonas arenae]|uniref:methionyl-tRNA formyltransferase n=1 Tax=Sphingomonas arenae TaxID=2812555 RepID=UPI001967FBB9|nr:formyltransferase family protein [Sphingomonas arenae]
MRAIVVGAVEGTRVALEAIASARDWAVVGLVTLPPELAGRHSDFVDVAQAAPPGCEVIPAPNCNDPAVVEQVRALRPDLLFVIGWSQICREPLLGAAPLGAVGFHPAPLPRLRGRAAIPWTILLGEPITAGTLFWIDEGTDTGPILAQRFFHVGGEETAASLYARHMGILRHMLNESLPAIASGSAPRESQDERFATWAAKRTQEDGRVDWNQPAKAIARLIRAVGVPYPGAFTGDGTERTILWAAEAWPEGRSHVAVPGQVVARAEGWFSVMCGDGEAIRVTAFDGAPPKIHSVLGR